MDKDKYISEYADAIRYILPHITNEEASAILNEQNKIDGFLENLSKFDMNVAKGLTVKYRTLYRGNCSIIQPLS